MLAIIDASAIAVKNAVDVQQFSADQFVENLIAWADLINFQHIALTTNESISSTLFDSDTFPSVARLRSFLSNSEEYDAPTVAKLIDRLLRITPTLRTHTGLEEVLTTQHTITPPMPQEGNTHLEQSRIENCLQAVCHAAVKTSVESLLIIGGSVSTEHRITATIDATDPTHYFGTSSLPLSVIGNTTTTSSAKTALARFDAAKLWVDTGDFAAAIQCHLARESETPRAYRIHSNFTAHQGQGDRVAVAKRILRTIADAVLKRDMAHTHALRESAGGNSPTVTRNQDSALRRDVDYELHLHYWECSDGSVELGCVVPHNCFDIPR